MVISGSVEYTDDKTPWNDPADGDFTLANVASATKTLQARGAGRGTFTQTQSGYGDPVATTSKPDIGAALRGGVLPAVADVRYDVDYGASGTEYAGLLELPNDGAATGTEDATSDTHVKSGSSYGSTPRTGTYTGSGGGGRKNIGALRGT